MSKAEELKKLCKPVVDWLKKNHEKMTKQRSRNPV